LIDCGGLTRQFWWSFWIRTGIIVPVVLVNIVVVKLKAILLHYICLL